MVNLTDEFNKNIPDSLGTAGQVLTVNSGATAGEWADAAGGAWQYITEVTASTDAYAAFPSSFTDTYDYYKVIAKDVKAPDANQSNFYVEVTTDGTNYDSPNYRNYMYFNQSSVTFLYSSGGEFSQNNGVATSADQVASFEATFYNMRGSTAHKFIRIEGSSRSGYTPLPHNPINAWLSRFDASAIQGFRFSTDNNISGNFKLYGLNKA